MEWKRDSAVPLCVWGVSNDGEYTRRTFSPFDITHSHTRTLAKTHRHINTRRRRRRRAHTQSIHKGLCQIEETKEEKRTTNAHNSSNNIHHQYHHYYRTFKWNFIEHELNTSTSIHTRTHSFVCNFWFSHKSLRVPWIHTRTPMLMIGVDVCVLLLLFFGLYDCTIIYRFFGRTHTHTFRQFYG